MHAGTWAETSGLNPCLKLTAKASMQLECVIRSSDVIHVFQLSTQIMLSTAFMTCKFSFLCSINNCMTATSRTCTNWLKVNSWPSIGTHGLSRGHVLTLSPQDHLFVRLHRSPVTPMSPVSSNPPVHADVRTRSRCSRPPSHPSSHPASAAISHDVICMR